MPDHQNVKTDFMVTDSKTPVSPDSADLQSPTIAAIATPMGRGGVGIIRLSGKTAYQIACALCRRADFVPRMATFCRFFGADGRILDEGIVLYFKAPHSFTGEDVVELQGHGGVVLQNLLLARLFELGARQAVAGEFSYRAFENNKLDLVQAEAIADAIDATSEAAALSAVRSLTGEFSQKIEVILQDLIHLRLYVEAAIDFPDEEDVDFLSNGVIAQQIDDLQVKLADILASAKQGQLLRDGIHVVLAGEPNAGKSSLLNRLAKQDRAIVTDIAGTTRDILQETIVLNGLSLHLTDTAGLRKTDDKVEKIGIERAQTAIAQADILLMVYDLTQQVDPLDLAADLFGELPAAKKLMIIGNKRDLLPKPIPTMQTHSLAQNAMPYQQINVSCQTGEGMDDLIHLLTQKADFHPPENSLIARTRHLDALKRTQDHLTEAKIQLTEFLAGELVAESLRLAQNSLGEITGTFRADDLLGKIFSSFCIGK